MAVSDADGVYITGVSHGGNLDGETHIEGSRNTFLTKYGLGEKKWTRLLVVGGNTYAYG